MLHVPVGSRHTVFTFLFLVVDDVVFGLLEIKMVHGVFLRLAKIPLELGLHILDTLLLYDRTTTRNG